MKKTIIITFILLLVFISTACAFSFFDNFDSYLSTEDINSNWQHVPTNGAVLDQSGGYNGSKAIKFTYAGSSFYPLEFNIRNINTDHVYARFKFKVEGNPVGGIKFLKIFGVNDGTNYANWTWNFGPTTATSSFLTALCYGNGSSTSNDTNVCIYPDGVVNGDAGDISLPVTTDRFYPTPGQWHEVATYNRYSTNGSSDGEMWMEIDGIRVLHVINSRNRHDTNSKVINKISFGDYSNPNANIIIWFDDIEISTDPLPASITPPKGLRLIYEG